VTGVDGVDLIAGVDTHLDTYTAAICDARGRAAAQLQVAATTVGYAELLAWAGAMAEGRRLAWAIEAPVITAWGPGPAPGRRGPAGQRDRQYPARGQAPGGQERPDRRGPGGPGTAGLPPAGTDVRRR
jgi:hypothetical protein